ncbi:MAG: CinA family nicotinamide mononucleotide deamidase-related protein [Anaerolineales bacterium]
MEAEIITIGTEILLGQIVDTNTRTIAQRLRDIGLDIYRTSTVGDNAARIAEAVRDSMNRAAVVITTGGLGPTIDDATREGIAQALGVETYFEPALWDQIRDRFASIGREPSENNRRQAHIPKGAMPIENPVGTAPAFLVDTETSVVIALPGVPAEMSYLLENDILPYLKQRLKLSGTILTRVVRTAGQGESTLDERIADLEQLSNPTVGLSAHPGRVDIRITAKAPSRAEAESMIWGVEATLQQRLGDRIYGYDGETLEQVVLDLLSERELTLAVVEHGTEGLLASSLAAIGGAFSGGRIMPQVGSLQEIRSHLQELMSETSAKVGLGLSLSQDEGSWTLRILRLLAGEPAEREIEYGGAFLNVQERGVGFALEFLRRGLLYGPDREDA